MKHHPPRTYLNGKVLPAGRRIFALESILAVACQVGDDALMMRCESALDINRQARQIEMRYQSNKSKRTRARGDSVEIDAQIGDVLAGMCTVAQGQAVGDDEVAKAALEFILEVAPDGIAALTRQSFEAQLADARVLFDRFESDLARLIELLGLGRHVAQLKVLIPRFARELSQVHGDVVTYSQVKESDTAARDAFAVTIFHILANYAENSVTRDALLHEYDRQLRLLSEYYRRHRRSVDIDPNTGETIEDSGDDGNPPELPTISGAEA